MIHSMTGFGKAEATSDRIKVTIEIRTINSKQADISMRMPNELRFLELPLRKQILEELYRGKIDLYFSIELLHSDDGVASTLTWPRSIGTLYGGLQIK